MGSDMSDGDHRSRRRKHEDDDREDNTAQSRTKRSRWDEDVDEKPKYGERSRERSQSRSRRREKRDRSLDSSRRRLTDRDPDRKRDRDHEGTTDRRRHRSRSRDADREGSKEKGNSRRRHRHRASRSPDGSSKRHRHRHRSSSPRPKEIDYPSSRKAEEPHGGRHHRDSPAAKPVVKARGPLPSQDADFAVSTGLEPEPEKEQPNFKPTGALAAAANAVTVGGTGETVTLKYHEPPEARKPPPRDRWKLFVFKGKDVVDTIELSLRSCWLVGRDRAVVDLPAEHPSISKQHAVLQFRHVEKRNEFGDRVGKVKPYLIDLESANGSVLNGDKVPESRYLEVRNQDVIRFGLSEREYVVMLDRE